MAVCVALCVFSFVVQYCYDVLELLNGFLVQFLLKNHVVCLSETYCFVDKRRIFCKNKCHLIVSLYCPLKFHQCC